MEFAQLVPIITTSITVLGSLFAALSRSEGAPRDVRLLTRLAEAAGHVGNASPGGQALDAALKELADDYATKARSRRTRRVNGASVAALIFIATLGSASVYFLSQLALWLAGQAQLGGWAVVLAIAVWAVVALLATLAIGLLAVGSRSIYDPPKGEKKDR